MPEPTPKPDPRRAYASAPVNQRTAPRATPRPAPVPAPLQARAQKVRQRQALGPSVSERLARAAPGAAPAQAGLHPGGIATAVCAVAAASALVLLRSGAGLALAAALAALGGAGWLWQQRSRRAAGEAMPPAGPALFDANALRRMDAAFDATAADVPEAVLAALISLKAAAVRVALALNGAPPDGDVTPEDRLYVVECLRRYIPDTLGAYLQVPAAQRSAPGADHGPSANDLLLSQLALLQSGLEQREQRLQGGAVEALRRQQRFLQAKAGRG